MPLVDVTQYDACPMTASVDSAGRRADCQRDGRVVSEETARIHRDSEDKTGLNMA